VKNIPTMARPIEKTPVIEGKDARTFRELLLNSLNSRFSSSEVERGKKELQAMKNSYDILVNSSHGVFY
jgi:hypothetical protein